MKTSLPSYPRRTMPAAGHLCSLLAAIMLLLPALSAPAKEFSKPETIGKENGLSTRYIVDIAQDKRGIMWIGTQTGLFRFDGYFFTHFSIPTPGFIGNTVESLYYDKHTDKLWIGTRSGLMTMRCDNCSFESPRLPEEALTYNISKISPAADGGVWIANHYDCITHVDSAGNATPYLCSEIKGMPTNISAVADDGRGHLIVGHDGYGITIINLKERTCKNYSYSPDKPDGIPPGKIHALLFDSHKNIWFSSSHGLSIFIPEREQILTFRHDPNNPYSIPGNKVFTIFEDSDGIIWAGCDMGWICTFNPSELTVNSTGNVRFNRHYLYSDGTQGMPNGRIHTIFQDSFGNIWMANFGNGLEFISNTSPLSQKLPYFAAPNKNFDNRAIWSVFTDRDGSILLGATNSVGIYNGDKITDVIDLSPALSHNYTRVQSIGRYGDKILIGLYDDGLLRLDRATRKVERVDLGMADIGINTFHEIPGFGTFIGASNGLWIYRDGKAEYPYVTNKVIMEPSISGILSDSKGQIWVSTLGNGVYIFDRDMRKMRHLPARLFESGTIKDIQRDLNDRVWVITKQNLCMVEDLGDSIRVERYNYLSPKRLEIFRAIIDDKDGNIWFSTDTGIHVREQNSGKFKSFRSGTEIKQSDFTDMAITVGKDGTLYFGSKDGACAVSTGILNMERKLSKILIVGCESLDHDNGSKGEGETFPPYKPVNLRYDDASIRIEYAVPDYAQSKSVEYAVMLEGLDKQWGLPSHDNYVNYRNLPPGKYTFKVRARLPNHEWDNTSIASVGIIVAPPAWKTWWAIAIYIICAMIIIYGIFRFYKRRIRLQSMLEVERKNAHNEKELNQERLRFYTNITHELRTPLTLILGPLEDLVYDKQLPGKYKEQIKVIHNSTLRLLNLVNQILEFRKTETQNRKLTVSRRNLSDFVTEIGLRYKELNRNDKVEFVIDVVKDENEIYFDPDIVTTVLNNLLSNAIKYTPAGSITLSLKKVNEHDCDYCEIAVADTGYGIEPEALKHIFERYYQAKGKHQASGTGIGLALVKSLTELHNGILSVESTPGKGTTFCFRILADNTYPDALHAEAEAQAPQTGDAAPEASDSRDTVLVVEDNADIREYIAKSLGSTFNILEASNGKEGLEAAINNNPDIIVSDLMMPVMDGLEMLKALKGDIRTSHIPIVLLTAKDSITDKEIGYDCGADSYLTKPFSAKLLKSRIRNILSSRKSLVASLTSKAIAGGAAATAKNCLHPGADNDLPQTDSAEIILSKFDRGFLEKFTSLVEKNMLMDNLDMAFIQENMNMSHSTLYRKIKGLTGLSGNEFIRKIRLGNALKLMLEGCSVSKAAYDSGFNDVGYFRACFKDEYGESPTRYVKNFRNSAAPGPKETDAGNADNDSSDD